METAPKHRGSWKEFLKRKQINFTVQTYFIDALGAMAFGLFASLLIGTIFSTIGEKTGVEVSIPSPPTPKGPPEPPWAYPLPMP